MVASQRIPSFEELYLAIEALPEGVTGEILEPGVIRTMGRPGQAHRLAARGLFEALGDEDAYRRGRSWWLEQEAEVRFGNRLTVPDMAGWRLPEGGPLPPEFALSNPIERCPDWCCEVLSTSTERVDRDTKLPLYAGAGVAWNWLVDPEQRRIEVYQTDHGAPRRVETIEGATRAKVAPFAVEMDLSRFWLPET